MSSIPSFGTSLLQNPPVKQTPAVSVEELLQNTPSAPLPEQVPDSFQHASSSAPAPKSGINWGGIGTTLLAAGGLFFMGRKGWLGKHIQTWFGGRMSLKNVHKNIEAKMSEFLGKGGANVQSAKVVKNAEGKNVLRAEFEGGVVKEFGIVENKNVIKLTSAAENGQESVILFNRIDGSPRSRVIFAKDKDGKVLEYASFKGGDILDAGFKDSENVYRSFSQTKPSRRYGIFGPKETKTTVRTYVDPETGNPVVSKIKTVYKHGRRAKIHQEINGQNRTFIFGDSGRLAQIQTKGADGKVVVQHFEYTTTPEGKSVISSVKFTDKKGNPLTPSA